MTEHTPAVDLVVQYWPLYGPHSPERATSAASVIAELVRYLTYATAHGTRQALPHAGDVDVLLGSLAAAAGGLEQTLRQLRRRRTALSTDPTVRHSDHPGNPDAATAAATAAGVSLAAAQQAAGALRVELATAQGHLAGLSHDPEEVSA